MIHHPPQGCLQRDQEKQVDAGPWLATKQTRQARRRHQNYSRAVHGWQAPER